MTDRNLIKEEALRGVQDGWPEKMKELVINTPIESMARSGLADRWNLPLVTPALVQEGIALGGDALHPMTPSAGQGGGTAIEDGIVLARTVGVVLAEDGGPDRIQKALEEYAALRQERTLLLTIKAFIIGVIFALEFPPLVYLRNNFLLPKLVGPSSFLSHTLFDVGKLPTLTVNAE